MFTHEFGNDGKIRCQRYKLKLYKSGCNLRLLLSVTVVACRYQILKWDQAGVFIREMVRTPVNRTLCHDLRTADTCHPDGSLVTCQ